MDEFTHWPNPYLLFNNLWWNNVMNDWNLDEKSLSKWQFLHHCKSLIPQKIYKEWQIKLG